MEFWAGNGGAGVASMGPIAYLSVGASMAVLQRGEPNPKNGVGRPAPFGMRTGPRHTKKTVLDAQHQGSTIRL